MKASGAGQFLLHLFGALLVLAVVFSSAIAFGAPDPGSRAGAPRLAAAIAEKVAAGEPVEALVLLDDSNERAARNRESRLTNKPAPHLMDAVQYAQHLEDRARRLGRLKRVVRQEIRGDDLEELTEYAQFPILHVRIKSRAALARLQSNKSVLSIDANATYQFTVAESLPLIGQPQAQAAGYTGAGTTVCVLDSGVDYTRPAFGSCSAPGGTCKVAYAADIAPDDGVLDDSLHGTAVSAIALAVAPDARLAVLDIQGANDPSTDVLISAIEWCITNKAAYNIAAINMSFGGGRYYAPEPPSDSNGVAFQAAVDAGIVVVASSGNSGFADSIGSPAAYSNVVSAGAVVDKTFGAPMEWFGCTDEITEPDKVPCFSNSAYFLTMLAPGAYIYVPGASLGGVGTSFAAPHVAGAAAVVRAAHPEYSTAQVISALKNGEPVTDHRNGIVKPRLYLPNALLPTSILSVIRVGAGSGTVVSNPAGISCGVVCEGFFASDSEVTLTATPDAGSSFAGWSGDCQGQSASCVVSMNVARDVTATFVLPDDNFPLGGEMPIGWATPSWADAGWVVTNDAAYRGPHSVKSAAIEDGQLAVIEVTGTWAAGNIEFAYRVSSDGDSEACCDFLYFFIDSAGQFGRTGEVPWTKVSYPVAAGEHTFSWYYLKNGSVSAGADAAWIDAVILPSGTVPISLNVTRAGSGSGTVASDPPGIDCGATCSAYFTAGSDVTLTATPDGDSVFTGWDGDCDGAIISCVVSMTAPRNVTATFDAPEDNFPPGGQMPIGWIPPPGADAGWEVASDSTYRGAYSLKSAAIGDSQTAAIQVAGTYAAGSVSFFHHVSSEACCDKFEFYVDGELKVSEAGAVPWTQASFALPAGSHTFKWVYAKDINTVEGADAAWIDSVVLPSVAADVLLNLIRTGSGSGTVTSDPAGIDCGAICTASFSAGSAVTLTATPDGDSVFTSWSGDCEGAVSSCVVSMNATTYVTANFALRYYTSTDLSASVNPSVFGQSVTFTAVVTGMAPTGTVTFKDGVATLCNAVALVSGQASCLTGALGVGSHSITAIYSGDGNNAGSTSPEIAHAVIAGTLDVDASITETKYDALSDGLLTIRYLFGLTGPALTNGALGSTATRTDPAVIKAYLDDLRPALDIDGNGTADALTDGLLIIRHLSGLRGDALIAGAVGPLATRTTAEAIEAYIQDLMP